MEEEEEMSPQKLIIHMHPLKKRRKKMTKKNVKKTGKKTRKKN
jgi:hypothetical protein